MYFWNSIINLKGMYAFLVLKNQFERKICIFETILFKYEVITCNFFLINRFINFLLKFNYSIKFPCSIFEFFQINRYTIYTFLNLDGSHDRKCSLALNLSFFLNGLVVFQKQKGMPLTYETALKDSTLNIALKIRI